MYRNTVTVIIPYFNARRTIVHAVKSVLTQTACAFETLVIDDGSSDDPTDALKEFGAAVTLIRKTNGGVASARNMGIERARCEWIAFLDADDYWEPWKLERQLTFSKDVGLIGGRWFLEYPGALRRIGEVPDTAFFGRIVNARGSEAFYAAMNFWTGVLLVRRNVIGDERFVSGLEPAEDRDLWIRLAASTPFYLVPEPLATYVQYENSLSNSDPDRDCGNMLRVVRRHGTLLGSKETREQEAVVYRRWASLHLARGTANCAVLPAVRRLIREPTSLQAWWIITKALWRSLIEKKGSNARAKAPNND